MIEIVKLKKFLYNPCPKGIPCASGGERKLVTAVIGIRPYEICHGSFVWDLSKPVDDFDLVDGVDARAQATMDAENGIVDHDTEGKKIEQVGEVMPYCGVAIFATAFGIEAVRLSDTSGFVVATDEMHA